VDGVCPHRPTRTKLHASEFQVCRSSSYCEVTVY
jgi:hypothetical protein